MEDVKRDILTQVARGDMTPEEAAARLEEVESGEPAGSGTAAAAPSTAPSGDLERIRITSEVGAIQVIGDPSVREAVADGPHVARREAGRLVIDHTGPEMPGDYWFSGGRALHHGHRSLMVRMNPSLALELDATAGSVRIRGVVGPITATIQAGSTTIEGFRGPLDLSSQAGSIRASGVLADGTSRISCQAGSIRLYLEAGSSVRVRARSRMGRVRIDGETLRNQLGMGVAADEVVVGDGRGSVEIEATMGTVRVETGR